MKEDKAEKMQDKDRGESREKEHDSPKAAHKDEMKEGPKAMSHTEKPEQTKHSVAADRHDNGHGHPMLQMNTYKRRHETPEADMTNKKDGAAQDNE